jgi:hypothetical protein
MYEFSVKIKSEKIEYKVLKNYIDFIELENYIISEYKPSKYPQLKRLKIP